MLCEICNEHEAIGLYIIRDSHFLEDRQTKRHLCILCIRDLKAFGVTLRRIEGIRPEVIDIPLIKTHSVKVKN